MKAVLLALSCSLLAFASPVPRAAAAGFPFPDPYYATITAAVLKGDDLDKSVAYRDLSLRMIPARDDVPYYGPTQNKIKLRYWPAATPAPAPLIVMITGLGGQAGATYYNFLAYHFVKQGYAVLSVPNPFHYSFALAASTTGYPGVTREDAADLYAVIQKGLEKLRRKAGLQYTSVGLIGVSLGALEAAYVAELDAAAKQVNFQRTLLINPPVDPLFGIGALDRLAAAGKDIPAARRSELQQNVLALGFATLIRGDINSPTYFDGLEGKLGASLPERQYLIGSSMQSFLQSLLFTTQQTEDLGVFQTPVATADPEPRLREAAAFSFTDYINRFLLADRSKRAGHPVTYEDILPLAGMVGVEPFLRADPRVLLMHNADDFIVNEEQLAYLRGVFGDRMTIYPHGGHLGNIWYPENLRAILGAFAELPR